MGKREREGQHGSNESHPLYPSALPPELADFLKGRPFGCVFQATDQGTVLVVKAPAREIRSVRGRVPMEVRHELYQHPAAPVIRTVVQIYDQPARPLTLETFTNVEDEQQRADFAALADQETVYLLFYDETLSHRLSKAVGNAHRATIREIVERADRMLAEIPKGRFSFEDAKAAVMQQTKL